MTKGQVVWGPGPPNEHSPSERAFTVRTVNARSDGHQKYIKILQKPPRWHFAEFHPFPPRPAPPAPGTTFEVELDNDS